MRRTHLRPAVAAVLTVAAAAALGLAGPSPASAVSDSVVGPVVAAPRVVPVLEPATASGRIPTSGQLAAALATPLSDPALAGPVGVNVVDARSGRSRYGADARLPLTPASTLKLLTAVAAIDALGSDHRLATRVVRPSPGHLVIVGGGDATLTTQSATSGPAQQRPASLSRLAALTAQALHQDGVHRVSVSYDASLFVGPSVDPRWPSDYVTTGVIAPVVALMTDQGRTSPTSDDRVSDPAAQAAAAFAGQLADRGIRISGSVAEVSGRRESAEVARAAPLATVESPPVAVLVAQMLRDSDNQVAEALGRLTAAATDQPASFKGAAAALLATAGVRHLPVTGWRLFDASGLSRDDRATAVGLAATMSVAAQDPTLSPIVDGLPVAGFTGTLEDRYLSGPAVLGAGLVRAKTGTLTGTNTQVGLVVTARGRLLAFAFLADHVPSSQTDAARSALDRAATALIGGPAP